MRCEHKYHNDSFSYTIVTWKIPGLQKYQTPCTVCALHGPITDDWTESIRLSKVKPGLKFNVFKYVGHAESEKPVEPKTTFTTYHETQWYPYPSYYKFRPYPNRSDDTIPF